MPTPTPVPSTLIRLTPATALLLCLLLAPIAGAGNGGGTVENVDPTATNFSGDQSVIQNDADAPETYTFTVRDDNGEADIQEVKITSTGFADRVLSDLSPGSKGNGWSVTDAVPGDGRLTVSLTHTWPQGQAPGTYTQRAYVRDEGSFHEADATDQTTIEGFSQVEAHQEIYAANGAVATSNWGAWTAAPGTSNVEAQNYLRAENTGTQAGSVQVSFTPTAFAGSTSSIQIDGNIRFLYGTGATPDAMSASMTSVDGDGALEVQVDAGQTVWITYRIESMPSPLPDGAYTAGYTFTAT